MLIKVIDVIFQCLWRHSYQFQLQKLSSFVWYGLVAHHFENSSATHA